ncbi:SusC/RagA family TonB-linked outer membrane protein [Mariniflexile gromovii]|uniref:TonB-dependent receptor n=1 Tax=Mariniflexile gromovii TaxID=362523 RepID=A0ABS4BQU8_9FLAO|nr:TonB-dependent receptor [Mariniflexile gromovii]MBP0902954.1 TonB-dependent receptor [Mariniflexile gromovii]
MKKKINSTFSGLKKKLLITILNSLIFLCFASVFAVNTNPIEAENKTDKSAQQLQITGMVTDSNGQPLAGANILEKGTFNGVQADFDGKFTMRVSSQKATLTVSYIGFVSKEVTVNNQSSIAITLTEDVSALNEVVVVGYGTRKRTTVTSAVSQVGSEVFENRPVANATLALQGAVGNLVITTTANGGEPGAQPNINIRGLVTSSGDLGSVGNSSPLILIDGAEMDISQINPEDIETVTVLKDAASASIYGARAAGGAIIITTKSGKDMKGGMKVSYTNNFSISQPTIWPEQASAIDFAYTMNDTASNTGLSPYYTEEELGWIQQNMANPGSAPTLIPNSAGNSWDQSNFGLGATGSTNWKDFLFSSWSLRSKHDINFRGGDEKLNYYISAGTYNEDGLLATTTDTYSRHNLDAKIASKPNKWLSFELLTKATLAKLDYPWDQQFGRGRVFDVLSKLKPTLPTVDPNNGEPLANASYPSWDYNRESNVNNQISILPRITIEPIKDLLINLQYNYRRVNNKQVFTSAEQQWTRPDGTLGYITARSQTLVRPSLDTNEYLSPNLFATYTKSVKGHNFDVTAGYQNEQYNVFNMNANAYNLLTDNVQSLSSAVGVITASDNISHWSTESVFGRFGYNYKEKYIGRVTYRRDGSSRFEPGNRLTGLPSFELGYNIAKENFWPIKDISMFKLRATQGSLGNQNVGNYLYISTLPISNGTFLFNGARQFFTNPPNLTSQNLTWETVKTKDLGIDILALKNRLGFTFDWYRSDTNNLASEGETLPAVLGTNQPLVNAGTIRVQGWEAELTWKQSLGDFNYNIRAVLSDYKQTVLEYPNPTNGINNNFYAGGDLGAIWGLTWEGWFQTAEEATERNLVINQRYVHNSTFGVGDAKYADLNGDGFINNGDGTLNDTGDFRVIGNSTPRYQYGITLGASWKGIDFNMFIQGVGKRDVSLSTHQRFRGPAQGPLHANVLVEHLDYFRPLDTTSPLGPNLDAYFPTPYAQNPGNNNRNYRFNTDHFLQNGAYTRLKTMQIGFTIPKVVTEKYKIDRIRIFVTGENLLTISKLMFYDPETVPGEFGSAYSYPLSKVISTGLNISF